jgi:hypothetical protein
MAENTDIYRYDCLTEEEDDSDNERTENFYKFISGKIKLKKYEALNDYLFHIGWDDKIGTHFLTEEHMQRIYDLLDKSGKKTMKRNYLKNIRKITQNPDFNFVGGARKSKRKPKKTRKSRKTRRH